MKIIKFESTKLTWYVIVFKLDGKEYRFEINEREAEYNVRVNGIELSIVNM